MVIFRGIRPVSQSGAIRDALAGVTLAAMNVPQALGYTRIAGTPVVTGLYTLLLPLMAFATLGSSRYLVVAADSATAAILAGGLGHMAAVASERYVALAGLVALLTAGCLLLARLLKLGFLADFLSQTVLVGFLTGVGFQVGIAVLGEMLGVPVDGHRTLEQLAQVVRGIPHAHLPTLLISGAVVAIVLVFRRFAPHLPGPLVLLVVKPGLTDDDMRGPALDLFDHQRARLRFHADVFWVREDIGRESIDSLLDTYQTDRDRRRRGIVEVIL